MSESSTHHREPQSAGAVLMVRPASFAFNSQTAASNAFQQSPKPGGSTPAHPQALREFDILARGLQDAGVTVIIADDTVLPPKPDAIFPNNWVSFHHDGSVVLYPMLAPNRRLERSEDIIQQVASEGTYLISRTIDLSHREQEGKYLEGTGSLVLDRPARVAYACLSPRTDIDVLGDFAQQLDYELVMFEAFDGAGAAVYHTNVVMAVGTRFAVVCAAAIPDVAQRAAVLSKLAGGGHDILTISLLQMQKFAGNLLELETAAGAVIALSTTAWSSLDPVQRGGLERCGRILDFDIPVIEACGGGGVRCMLAEIHLPKRNQAG